MTQRGMLWHALGEQEDSTPVPSPGALECQLSSFTGEGGDGEMRREKGRDGKGEGVEGEGQKVEGGRWRVEGGGEMGCMS